MKYNTEKAREILEYISKNGFVRMKDIMKNTGIAQSQIYRILKLYQEIGLVKRNRNKEFYISDRIRSTVDRHRLELLHILFHVLKILYQLRIEELNANVINALILSYSRHINTSDVISHLMHADPYFEEMFAEQRGGMVKPEEGVVRIERVREGVLKTIEWLLEHEMIYVDGCITCVRTVNGDKDGVL